MPSPSLHPRTWQTLLSSITTSSILIKHSLGNMAAAKCFHFPTEIEKNFFFREKNRRRNRNWHFDSFLSLSNEKLRRMLNESQHQIFHPRIFSHHPSEPLSSLLSRGGTSPIFSSPSWARALSVEPERARVCPNYLWAFFEPEIFTNINAKIWVRAYLQPFRKLGSLSL